MSVADFEAYRKRAARMKALEGVLDAAKKVFIAQKTAQASDVFFALAVLKKSIEECDKLPPPHGLEKK